MICLLEGGNTMAATVQDIAGWLIRGKGMDATHVIVVCDTHDYDDYPVFVKKGEDVRVVYERFSGKNGQIVMEVYNLGLDLMEQLKERRAFHF